MPADSDDKTTCPGCGSDQRTDYVLHNEHEHDGQRITWKRTMCRRCGQHRIDRFVAPLKSPPGTPSAHPAVASRRTRSAAAK